MKKTLREDQTTAITNLRLAARETRRPLMQGPTGFGKTVVMAAIVELARAKDKRVVVTVPALSLIDQTVDAFYQEGIEDVGVIQADHHMTNGDMPVQVASVQTLVSRGIANLQADIVLVDEVHRFFKLYESWFTHEDWQKKLIIGFSATPWTKGLGAYFDKLVVANTIDQMIREGTLAPFRVFAAARPDLEGVRTSMGDWVQSDLEERVRKPKLIADIVETWKQLGENRPTVAFCVSQAHADQIATEFRQAGIPSGYMDCDTPVGERNDIRERFKNGEIKVVCNVDVIGLGVDWPEVSCISYCRPTKSEMRWVQNIGRGLRISRETGKTDCLIIDHSDTTRRLGFVSDIQYAELDDGKRKEKAEKSMALPKECPQCHYMKPPHTAVCPNCGFEAKHHAPPIMVQSGKLEEVRPEQRRGPAAKFPDQRETYAMLLGYAQMFNKQPGMAFFKFRDIYGSEPPRDWGPWGSHRVQSIAPSAELITWIRSQNIRWVKSERSRFPRR